MVVREDISDARDAKRTVKVAVLAVRKAPAGHDAKARQLGRNSGARTSPPVEPKLNANQHTLIRRLAAAGGRARYRDLQSLDVPRSTLGTLVKRGLIEITEEPAKFHVSRVKARPIAI